MESTLEKLASKSLIIAGETGTKKTRLAKAIARLAFDAGKTVYVFTEDEVSYPKNEGYSLRIRGKNWIDARNVQDSLARNSVVIFDELNASLDEMIEFKKLYRDLSWRGIKIIGISQASKGWPFLAGSGVSLALVAETFPEDLLLQFEDQQFAIRKLSISSRDRFIDRITPFLLNIWPRK
jgi:hypothetical protein